MDRPEILKKVLEQVSIARDTGILDCTNFGIKHWDSEALGDLSFVTKLILDRNQIGAEGAKALSTASHLSSLTQLNLWGNQIGAEGARALSTADHLSSLTELNLGFNAIGAEGARALSTADHLTSLTQLNLRDNAIGAEVAKALSTAKHLSSLTHLDLTRNDIGAEGAKALSTADHLSSLTWLYLGDNHIGAEGAKALSTADHLSSLTQLNLGGNAIGNEGAEALFTADHLSSLTELNLARNHIGAEGAKALSTADHLSSLTQLNLWDNDIGDDGARALALSAHLVSLRILKLSDNAVDGYNTGLDDRYDRLKRHFQRLQSEGESLANEARLFLIGQPRAGKSTLFDKVFDPATPVPNLDKKRTIGVEISPAWPVEVIPPKDNLPSIQAYLWDFGGDEIQHMCHQYFLSKDVLYVLLLRTDTTEKEIVHWLDTLVALAPNARVLPVKNMFDSNENSFSWDVGQWGRRKYQERLVLLDPVSVNFQSEASSKQLNTRLEQELNGSKFLPINAGFRKGREDLLAWAKADNRDYVTKERFEEWCNDTLKKPKNDPHYIEDFLHYLDWVGAIIYFESHELLVLHFEWITKGLYTVLPPADETRNVSGNPLSQFYDDVLQSGGYFSKPDLLNAWEEIIPNVTSRKRLFEVLEANALDVIYSIDRTEERYFVPAYLEEEINPADWMAPLKMQNSLMIAYNFDFVPHGLMSQLIVRFNQDIKKVENTPQHWKNGFILSLKKSQIEGYIFEKRKPKGSQSEPNKRIWLVLHAKDGTPLVDTFREMRKKVEALLERSYPEIKPPREVPCPNCFDTNDFEKVALLPYEDFEDQYEHQSGRVQQFCRRCKQTLDLSFIFDQHSKTRNDNTKGENVSHYHINGPVYGPVGENAEQKINTQNIQNNMQTLAESGDGELAKGLSTLINKVGESDELSDENKQKVLEALALLSEQAVLAPEERQSHLKFIAEAVGGTLGAAANLTTIWAAVGPVIVRYFT